MEFQVIVTNRQGQKLAEIPDCNVSELVWTLNEAGSGRIAMHPLSPGASQVQLFKTEFQVWIDGVLRHVLVPWRVSGSSAEIVFECEGLLSLFNTRFVDRMSLLYTSLEQRTIAWNLLAYAQDESVQANRDFNIDSAVFSGTTQVRSRNYERNNHDNILDLLQEFPTLSNGFDFDIVVQGDGSRLWTPYHPAKGSLKPDYALQYELGGDRNIVGFQYSEDVLLSATEVYVTGGSSGDVRFEENYEDVAASAAMGGVIQTVISEGSQQDVGWLLERAQKEVALRGRPIVSVTVTGVVGAPVEMFGNVTTGDSLPVRIDYGRINVNANQRVQSVKLVEGNRLDLEFLQEVS